MARRGSDSARRSSRLSSTAAASGSGGSSAGVPSHHTPGARRTRATGPGPVPQGDREGDRAERPRDEGRRAGARRRHRIADGRPRPPLGQHVGQRDGAPPQEVRHDHEVREGEDLGERPQPGGDARWLGAEGFLLLAAAATARRSEVHQDHEGGEREERGDGGRQAWAAGSPRSWRHRRRRGPRHPDHGGQTDHEARGQGSQDVQARTGDR